MADAKKIKIAAGAIIYNDEGKIFLMSSPKWKKWIIPGGAPEPEDKDYEDTLRREIREELGIELENVMEVGRKIKPPSADFKDPTLEFHFIDFFAKAASTDIHPDSREISEWGWFTPEEALQQNINSELQKFIEQFIIWRKSQSA